MATAPASTVREAIERVCAGELRAAGDFYRDDFVDHVNDMEFRGREGVARSVGLYVALFEDLRFTVDDQVGEGDRVASRWRLNGRYRGRPVELWGITISRLVEGRIAEDWGASDTLALVRQVGAVRLPALAFDYARWALGARRRG